MMNTSLNGGGADEKSRFLEEHGVMLEFIKPGKPTKNSFIERFKRM